MKYLITLLAICSFSVAFCMKKAPVKPVDVNPIANFIDWPPTEL